MKQENNSNAKESSNHSSQLERIRHSCSHIMAAAVKKLFPNTKLGIGPVIEEGFYYDLDSNHIFSPEDFKNIEKEMQKIIEKNDKFEKEELSPGEAKKLFKDEPYKLELIEELEEQGEKISIYKTGDFVDLCRGPHVNSSREIKAFKLMKVAGAYWKGSSDNKQLQRIYGTAFSSKEELTNYIMRLTEAEKRDHRKLGKELDLFMMHDLSLAGCPFFLPKGTIIYNELMTFMREQYAKRNYQEVITPQIYKKELWETSGHWEHYKEDMFTLKIGEQEYSLKPMNCPSHLLIYKSRLHSYKDLPLRIADFCPLHRNELGGVLGGLTRVVKFSQDDSHCFITSEQIESEIVNVLDFIKFVYSDTLKVEFKIKLSTRPEKFMGEKALWNNAEKALMSALKKTKLDYDIKEGEGAFYGPKIDCDFKDSLGRSWQLATVQLDFQLPLRFDATFEGADGKKHGVVMVHHAILGSLERFIGVMIEHYAGKFPTWLSPVQVSIITVADRHEEFAKKLKEEMLKANIRVEVDARQESIGKKVRDNQHMKIPYIITVGDKEIESMKLAVRLRDSSVKEFAKDEFIRHINKEIKERVS